MKRLLFLSRSSGRARIACWLCLLVAWSGAVVGTLLHAQVSDEAKKKRDAFLKAREEMRTVGSPTPSKSPKPKGKPKAATKKKKGSAASSKKKSSQSDDDNKATPRSSKRKKASEDDATPSKKSKSEDEEDTSPRRAPTPKATPDLSPPLPKPEPSQSRNLPPADITIQKSGVEEEQGFEPPPPPPPKRSFWSRLFGGGGERNYRYLNRSVIDAIRRAPVQRSRWKFIIVHNSGTRQGNAKAFDYYHRKVRRMQNGMAYHFVVGNGRSSGDGEIEIGSRWTRQINGGHVHSDYLNNISLGICLVGDFNRDKPTAAQLAATEELIKYLRDRCGKAEGRAIPVRPHREMNPPRYATDCPGDAFPYSWFRRF